MLLIVGETLAIRITDASGAASGSPGRSFASGAPAIAAWVAARLGTPTAFVGGVGVDPAGTLIRSALAGAGVDTTALVEVAARPSATADVEYRADGSREFQFAVAGTAATAVRVGDLADLPERASWLHVSGSALLFGDPLAATVREAVARAAAAGATVSVDPNLRPELADAAAHDAIADLCRGADVLFPSDGELETLGLDAARLARSGAVLCRTMAEAGARLVVGDGAGEVTTVDVPAIATPEQVIDPDGAGDTFAAGVIAGRMAGLDWPAAMRAAARVVARCIAVVGPMSADIGPADLATH